VSRGTLCLSNLSEFLQRAIDLANYTPRESVIIYTLEPRLTIEPTPSDKLLAIVAQSELPRGSTCTRVKSIAPNAINFPGKRVGNIKQPVLNG
jgi:hypothetical protein